MWLFSIVTHIAVLWFHIQANLYIFSTSKKKKVHLGQSLWPPPPTPTPLFNKVSDFLKSLCLKLEVLIIVRQNKWKSWNCLPFVVWIQVRSTGTRLEGFNHPSLECSGRGEGVTTSLINSLASFFFFNLTPFKSFFLLLLFFKATLNYSCNFIWKRQHLQFMESFKATLRKREHSSTFIKCLPQPDAWKAALPCSDQCVSGFTAFMLKSWSTAILPIS